MAIRNEKLGGIYFVDGEVLYDYDLDDTNNAIIDLIGVGQAQNAYQILQANDVFENKDFLATDEFVDSNSTNNTVNIVSTTSTFNIDNYILNINDETSSGTTHDPDSFTNPENAFDGNNLTSATKSSSGALGKLFSTSTFISSYIKCSASVTNSGSGDVEIVSAILQSYDGSTWNNITTLFNVQDSTSTVSGSFDGIVDISTITNIQGLRVSLSVTTGNISQAINLHTLEYGNYNSLDLVVCDANIKTLDGTEDVICIYADKTTPTNTNITVDISDGSTTLSSKNLNEIIPLTGFTNGNLELTFNLSTTDTSITPELKGYGVYIK